jgi:hypothetical protein
MPSILTGFLFAEGRKVKLAKTTFGKWLLSKVAIRSKPDLIKPAFPYQ